MDEVNGALARLAPRFRKRIGFLKLKLRQEATPAPQPRSQYGKTGDDALMASLRMMEEMRVSRSRTVR